MNERLDIEFEELQRPALLVGIAGVILLVIGAFFDQAAFFRAYLIGYLFWTGIALGCIGVLMLHHLTGGTWGFVIRRLLEAGARTLPLMAVLFVPLVLGLQNLYPWSDSQTVAADPLLEHKSPYLNVPFFLIRAAIYLVIWAGLAWYLTGWSRRQDETAEAHLSRRGQRLSAPGLILYALTGTFAAIDWIMSLEPHWFSTIYGILVIFSQILSGLAFVIIILFLLKDRAPLSEIISPNVFNDLGNLLIATLLGWAYLAFTQFLVIWSGNLPEEITWYLNRTQSGWQWIAIAIVGLSFVVPFALLLSRSLKRQIRALSAVALLIVIIRLVDTFWMVIPAFYQGNFHLHWLDLIAPVAIGGLWIALFVRYVQGSPLLPQNDPRLQEIRQHE